MKRYSLTLDLKNDPDLVQQYVGTPQKSMAGNCKFYQRGGY